MNEEETKSCGWNIKFISTECLAVETYFIRDMGRTVGQIVPTLVSKKITRKKITKCLECLLKD